MTTAAILLKVTVIMALALAGARLARRTRASVRHVLLAAAFASLVVLPIASSLAPSIRLAIPVAAGAGLPAPIAAVITEDAAPPVSDAGGAPAASASAGSPWPSASAILLAAWLAGLVACLAPVFAGLWQVRSLRRSAIPWPESRPLVTTLAAEAGTRPTVEVLLHESLPGPMTCGVFRPVIILPIDAPAWPAEDLRRAIVHELEHVRRADWFSQCGARIVAACYWFHPIVWVAWRRLALEAERACDDAVVGYFDPAAYADQLVGLARRLSTAARQPHLAMANRHDLSKRVVAVLDAEQPRGRAGARFVGMAIAATTVLAIGVSSIRLVSATVVGEGLQALPNQARPRYDAATIKPCVAEGNPTGARGTAGGTNATFSPGRFFVPCVTTEQLIYLAYASYGAREDERLVNDDAGSASNATKIRGGPAWVHSLRDKYSVEATAAGATERTVLMGAMLQSLLEGRFHLKIHRDTEEVDLLSMTVAKSGFKLKPMQDGDCDPNQVAGPVAPGGKPKCGNLNMMSNNGLTKWTWGTGTMSGLAGQISRVLGVHVVDKTGIADTFVYAFEFKRGEDAFATESFLQSALGEQLGLKLDRIRGPRGFLVIDSIERPTPDGPTVYVSVPSRAQGVGGQRQ